MQELKRLVNKYSSRLKQGKGEPDFFYLMRLVENLRSDTSVNLPLQVELVAKERGVVYTCKSLND